MAQPAAITPTSGVNPWAALGIAPPTATPPPPMSVANPALALGIPQSVMDAAPLTPQKSGTAWFDQLEPAPGSARVSQSSPPSSGTDTSWFDRLESAPGSSTRILDSLPAVGQTPGMRASSGTAVLDSLPTVAPTSGMLAAGTATTGATPAAMQAGRPQGVPQNFAAGANRTIFGALGAPVDLATRAINDLTSNPISGYQGIIGPQPVGGSAWLERQWERLTGTNPENVQPTTEGERMAQAAGAAAAQVPMLAMGGAGLARATTGTPQLVGQVLARTAGATAPQAVTTGALAASGGATGQLAEDAAPPQWKPVANLAGNIAGAGIPLAIGAAVRAPISTVATMAGRVGIGPHQTVQLPDGSILRATGTQQQAAAQRLYQAGGEQLQSALSNDPLADTEARLISRLQDQDVQANPALHAELSGRLQSVQSAMASRGSQYELLPGEQPTLGQVAPLPGVLQGQRAAAMNPSEAYGGPAFQQRAIAQNAARVGAIDTQAPADASPAALGDFFVNRLNDLDHRAATTEAGLRGAVQAHTEALGGTQSPLAIGQGLAEAVQQAQAPVVAERRALWQAVDPDGTWALPAPSTTQAAANVLNELSPAAVGRLGGTERSILNEAANLPGVVRFANLGQLRADANAAIREIGQAQGWQSPGVRRMELVKQGIDGDIAQAVSQRATQEAQAVATGSMAAQDTAMGRMQANYEAKRDAWLLERQQADATGFAGGVGGEAGYRYAPGAGPAAVSGPPGAASAAGGRPGVYTGTAGVSPYLHQPLEPNLPPEAAAAYQRAVAATRAEKQRFGHGVTGQILRAGRNGEEFRLPRSDVPGAVISGGASQSEDVANYLTATGGSPASVRALNNAVVARLRNGGAIDPDGIVNVKKLDAWTLKHTDTLRQLPDLRTALGDAGTAQRTLNAAAAQNRAEAQAFRDGIARRFLNGQDPHQAVYGALSGRNSANSLNAIIDAVQGDKSALASLRQHVADFLLDRFAPESAAPGSIEGGERGTLQARGFRAWMDSNRTPLRRLFGGQGVQNLELVSESLRRATPPAAAVAGSQTAPNFLNAARSGLHALTHGKGIGYTVMGLLGERLAEAHGAHALWGIAGGMLGKAVVDRLSASGMRTVNDLVGAAYLHPEVARALMEHITPDGLSGMAAKRIGAALQRALISDTTAHAATPAPAVRRAA